VTDAGIILRSSPTIPWGDIENIELDGIVLKIWLARQRDISSGSGASRTES
jgi:hypothetical protein